MDQPPVAIAYGQALLQMAAAVQSDGDLDPGTLDGALGPHTWGAVDASTNYQTDDSPMPDTVAHSGNPFGGAYLDALYELAGGPSTVEVVAVMQGDASPVTVAASSPSKPKHGKPGKPVGGVAFPAAMSSGSSAGASSSTLALLGIAALGALVWYQEKKK